MNNNNYTRKIATIASHLKAKKLFLTRRRNTEPIEMLELSALQFSENSAGKKHGERYFMFARNVCACAAVRIHYIERLAPPRRGTPCTVYRQREDWFSALCVVLIKSFPQENHPVGCRGTGKHAYRGKKRREVAAGQAPTRCLQRTAAIRVCGGNSRTAVM